MRFLIELLVKLIPRIIKDLLKIRPTHMEGYSDGTTEKKLKEKARKDGWDV